jgi:hypothetical protein
VDCSLTWVISALRAAVLALSTKNGKRVCIELLTRWIIFSPVILVSAAAGASVADLMAAVFEV